jgi:hypothetical protein
MLPVLKPACHFVYGEEWHVNRIGGIGQKPQGNHRMKTRQTGRIGAEVRSDQRN